MGILKNLLVTGSARFVNKIKGTIEKADELSTARSIQTNLASTTATFFDGSENITPGVTGTLSAAHGGTGETSLQNAGNAMLNALGTGSSTPTDNDYYISQYVGGGTTTTTYHRRPMSALWAYIKTKVEALGYTKNTGTVTKVSTGAGLTGGDVTTTGTIKANLVSETKLTNAAAAATQTSGRVYPVALDKNGDLAVNVPWTDNNTTALGSMTGTLGVGHGGTGATSFTSGQALIGNGSNAITTRAIRNNTTQGSIGWTSGAASTALLTQNDIAYWNGRYNDTNSNLKYTSVGELKAAATYEVQTTVANDAKLPTGAAVKSFVEGKGYVTTDTNNRRSFFGTCSTAAATAEKVVTLENNTGWELIAGVIVGVKFTITNTASNVKLNVNGSGAKPIYWDHAVYTGNNSGITGYANRVIYYMYDGTNWVFINHSQNYANNSDTYDRTYLSNSGYKAKSAIVSQNIIVAGTDGLYFHLKTGDPFDITQPILFANGACSANSTANNGYIIMPFTVTTTQSITLTAYKAVYIKGYLVGTTFTPVSTTPLTQTVPTSADGYQYILLGRALNSTTVMYLLPEHPIYEYTDGCFHLVGDRQVKDIVVQVSLSGWSSSTTTVNGSAYYTNTIALSYLTGTGDHKPRISIEPTPGNILPTQAEQDAYDLLNYAIVNNATLTLYATAKPLSSFYINLSEASRISG